MARGQYVATELLCLMAASSKRTQLSVEWISSLCVSV